IVIMVQQFIVVDLRTKVKRMAVQNSRANGGLKVYKFGGASISTIERMQASADIMKKGDFPRLIVVSAMGKTTNALEAVVEAFFAGKKEDALMLFEAIKQAHEQRLKFLLSKLWQPATEKLHQVFTEVEWLLHDKPIRSYD